MKLIDSEQKDFFLKTAYDIAESLGYKHTINDIESLCEENDYLLHLPPIHNSHLHIGIYPVGKWNYQNGDDVSVCCQEKIQKELIYADKFNDFDILVFATHEWDDVEFKAAYSNLYEEIVFNDSNADTHKQRIIDMIRYYQKNPITAYYHLVDFDEVCLCHKSTGNKVKVFCKAWFKNVILKKLIKFE